MASQPPDWVRKRLKKKRKQKRKQSSSDSQDQRSAMADATAETDELQLELPPPPTPQKFHSNFSDPPPPPTPQTSRAYSLSDVPDDIYQLAPPPVEHFLAPPPTPVNSGGKRFAQTPQRDDVEEANPASLKSDLDEFPPTPVSSSDEDVTEDMEHDDMQTEQDWDEMEHEGDEEIFDDLLDLIYDLEDSEMQIILSEMPPSKRLRIVNATDSDSFTPLMIAATTTDPKGVDMVRTLVEAQADVNYTANDGSTALDCCVQDNLHPIIDLLLSRPDIDVNSGRCSSLCIAARIGSQESVSKLLKAKARVDRRGATQITPLLTAIKKNFPGVVQQLLEAKAQTNFPNSYLNGFTPLIVAMNAKNIEATKLLLDAKADPKQQVTVKTGKMITVEYPIIYAARAGCVEILQLLDSMGVDTHVRDSQGKTLDQIVGIDWRNADTSTSERIKKPSSFTLAEKSSKKDADAAIYQGTMIKGSGLQKKKRYFVLSKSHLLYFKSDADYSIFRTTGGAVVHPASAQVPVGVVGMIPLAGADLQRTSAHRFTLKPMATTASPNKSSKAVKLKTFKFKCLDESSSFKWIQSIRSVVQPSDSPSKVKIVKYAPGSGGSGSDNNKSIWYYRLPNGRVQGPHKGKFMQESYERKDRGINEKTMVAPAFLPYYRCVELWMKPIRHWFGTEDPKKVFQLSDSELQERRKAITLPEDSWSTLALIPMRRVVEFIGTDECGGQLNRRWRLVTCHRMLENFIGSMLKNFPGQRASAQLLLDESLLRIKQALKEPGHEEKPKDDSEYWQHRNKESVLAELVSTGMATAPDPDHKQLFKKRVQGWIDTCDVKPPPAMQRASLRWPQFVLPREQAVKLAESCLEFTGKKVFPDVEIKIKGEFAVGRFSIGVDDSRMTIGKLKRDLLEECRSNNLKICNLPDENGNLVTRLPGPEDASQFIFKIDRYNDFLLWDDWLLLQHSYVIDAVLQIYRCPIELIHVSQAEQEALRAYRRSFDALAASPIPPLVSKDELRLRSLANAKVENKSDFGAVLIFNLGEANFTGAIADKVIKANKKASLQKASLQLFVSLLFNGKVLRNSKGEPLVTSMPYKTIQSPKTRAIRGGRGRYKSTTELEMPQLDMINQMRDRNTAASQSSIALNRLFAELAPASASTDSGFEVSRAASMPELEGFLNSTCQLEPETEVLMLPIPVSNLPFETRVQISLKAGPNAMAKASPAQNRVKINQKRSNSMTHADMLNEIESIVTFASLPLLDEDGRVPELNFTELELDEDPGEEHGHGVADNNLGLLSSGAVLVTPEAEVCVRIPDLRHELSRVKTAIAKGELPPLVGVALASVDVKATSVCQRLIDQLKNDPLLQLGNDDLFELWSVRQHYMRQLVKKFSKLKPAGGFFSSHTANGSSYWALLPSLFLATNYTTKSQRLEIYKLVFDLVENFLPKDIAVAAAVTDSADGNADPSAATDSTATKPTRPEFGCAIPVEVLLALTGDRISDTIVREFAVTCLMLLSNSTFKMVLPQLVQCIKHENHDDSALARLLLCRALRSPSELGHELYYLLLTEMQCPLNNGRTRARYAFMTEVYLHNCDAHVRLLQEQLVVNKIISMTLRDTLHRVVTNSDLRTQHARALLSSFEHIIPDTFMAPLSPRIRALGINVSKCRVFSSKKAPLGVALTLESHTENPSPMMVIYKEDDDLRQDILTLQVLKLMRDLWRNEGLNLPLIPYGVTSTGFNKGYIEMVPNSKTIGSIQLEGGGAMNNNCVLQYIENNCGQAGDAFMSSSSKTNLVDKFARSSAGYCVVTYVLGIGDRHPSNIMLDSDGHLFHIDFGHFLGHWKTKAGIKYELTKVTFYPSLFKVLTNQGLTSDFFNLCGKALSITRKFAPLIIQLFVLMIPARMPELLQRAQTRYLVDSMHLSASKENALSIFLKEFDVASRDFIRTCINFLHQSKHYSKDIKKKNSFKKKRKPGR